MILLDTHIWIWSHIAPERLPAEITVEFERDGTEFCISAISIWETLLICQRGKIKTTLSPEQSVRKWLSAGPLEVIPISAEVAILSRTLEFSHSDPADQFIAATAYYLDCPLATMDDRLRRLKWLKVLP